MLAPATEPTVAMKTYSGACAGYRTESVIIHRSTPLGKGTKEESSTAAAANPQIPQGRRICSTQLASLLNHGKIDLSCASQEISKVPPAAKAMDRNIEQGIRSDAC